MNTLSIGNSIIDGLGRTRPHPQDAILMATLSRVLNKTTDSDLSEYLDRKMFGNMQAFGYIYSDVITKDMKGYIENILNLTCLRPPYPGFLP